ncbi:hypothetical protein [Millionella massiliensis]|uniref:hypothetical protein n=1 Tax=Millionella massiliensis TaxID=1871023 RepID=UPI0023A83B57|nr:hypothetical protein [Millionella massiliensis]
MKKSLLNAAILVVGMTCAFSCKAQQEEINEPQRIELRSEQDQFLLNFVEATPEGLSLSISREDALYAGATSDGYADLEQQVAQINADYDKVDYDYWQQSAQQQQSLTKANAVYNGTYDKYNVLERDKFLENFVYAENGEVVLKISEEKAVLCGATAEGYRSVRNDVAELNRMVQSGEAAFDDVRACFDAKREFILEHGSLVVESKVQAQNPPATYLILAMNGPMRQASGTCYADPEVFGVLSCNYFLGQVVLRETSTGQQLTHWWGYTTKDTFKAGLIYPQGAYYSFIANKGTDSYDATARIVQCH